MKFTREFLQEKLGLDQPTPDGGTTSTGKIARLCFQNENDFIFWVTSIIPTDVRECIRTIHMNLFAIMWIYCSSQKLMSNR